MAIASVTLLGFGPEQLLPTLGFMGAGGDEPVGENCPFLPGVNYLLQEDGSRIALEEGGCNFLILEDSDVGDDDDNSDIDIGGRLTLVYSTTTERWWVYDEGPTALFVEEDTDRLTAGYDEGFVRNLEVSPADARRGGTDDERIPADIETKDFTGNSMRTRKLFLWARVTMDCTDGDAQVSLYVDGVLKRTTTVTGGRTRVLIPFPAGSIGYRWRIRVTTDGTARPIFYAAAAIWQTLRPA